MNNAIASKASILMKTGACVGGTIIGYLSQWVGRRRAMCVAALISACLIPAWILPNQFGSLAASGFMLQFFVQGAWGVIPIHLNELSPPAFRSTFPGREWTPRSTVPMKLISRSDLPARQHDLLAKCSDRQCHRRIDQYQCNWRAVGTGIRSHYG